jgi:bacteriocin-like protein
MKTINNFKQLSKEELNETIGGGYYVIITLPDGSKVRVHVR